MTSPAAYGPLSDLTDDKAMLYLGHLTAQAEMALPGASRETQLALTWIAAQVASEKTRLWTADLDNICIEGTDIGSWQARVRTSQRAAHPITIERRATLREDGRQITALTSPFALTQETPNDPSIQLESVLNFSIMTLAKASTEVPIKCRICDANGTQMELSMRKKHAVKNYLKFFRI